MPEFLSEQWVDALNTQLASASSGSSPHLLYVQYIISKVDGSSVDYYLELGPETDRAHHGSCTNPSIIFKMEIATALAISTGELSSEEAFINGNLKLDGDPTLLIEAYQASPDA